jgi:hypothetical protein
LIEGPLIQIVEQTLDEQTEEDGDTELCSLDLSALLQKSEI